MAVSKTKCPKLILFTLQTFMMPNYHDFWYEINHAITRDTKSLEKNLLKWRNMVFKGQLPQEHDFTSLLQNFLNDLPLDISNHELRIQAQQLTFKLIDQKRIVISACHCLSELCHRGFLPVISTFNYEAAAQGFFDAINQRQLIDEMSYLNTQIIGTQIDWESHSPRLCNVGEMKIKALCQRFDLSRDELRSQTQYGFISDPTSIDIGLATIAQQVFVIRNHQNTAKLSSPSAALFRSWQEIDQLLGLEPKKEKTT